ncbi:hypothetical protein H4R24_004033 [Coemansia sp. RSA 988]|nr:hypothetical protein H4R24_004033 [Coemansia sp. RSA 988]
MATPEAPLRELLKSISFTQLPLRHIDPFFKPETINTPRLFIYGTSRTRHYSQKNKLPTYDVECLRTLILLRFVNYEFDISFTNEPNGSPNGKLPYILLPNGQTIDRDRIQEHLEKTGHVLSETNLPDELVYCIMVERNLIPAIEYMAWVDPVGFEAIGMGRYLFNYPSSIRSMLGRIKSSKVANALRIGQPEYGAALDNEVLCDNALRTLESLLVLLGNRQYLAGAPSALDALVAACVNVILEAPLKSPIRSALLLENSKFKPLVDYALRILECHMVHESSE